MFYLDLHCSNYGDVNSDQAYNAFSHQKLEMFQYNAGLALTTSITGTFTEKLYQELGLVRHWYSKLCCFYEVLKSDSPSYLFNTIPTSNSSYRTKISHNILQINISQEIFKNYLFPSTTKEWNELDYDICNSLLIFYCFTIFKSKLLKFNWFRANSVFDNHNPKGIKLIARLRLVLSHLRKNIFKHSFRDSLNPFCACDSGEIESGSHYLLHCSLFVNERITLLNSTWQINPNILEQNDSVATRIICMMALRLISKWTL